jgi:hypothetical protein
VFLCFSGDKRPASQRVFVNYFYSVNPTNYVVTERTAVESINFRIITYTSRVHEAKKKANKKT